MSTTRRSTFVTKSGRRSKIPTFHPIATKMDAVKEIHTIMMSGVSRSKACSQLAKTLKVHRTTIENWLVQYGNLSQTTITPQQANHINATRKPFSINSLTLNTDNGYVKLTPNDIRNIANLAKLV